MFGDEVEGKGGEHLQEHVEGHVLKAHLAYDAHDGTLGKRQKHAEDDAAYKGPDKRDRGVPNGEDARHEGGDGKLEGDDARCVVEQALPLEERLLVLGNLDALAEGRDRHGVGRAEGGGQGKGGGQEDRGHEPMGKEAHHEHNEQHEAQR